MLIDNRTKHYQFKKWLYNSNMTTGQKIKQLRKEKGWSQTELSKATGLHMTIISRYEGDEAFPNGHSLISLSRALGISTDFLLFEDAPRTNRIAIHDAELYEKFLFIEKMPEDDRKAIKVVLQGMIVKNKLQDLIPDAIPSAKPQASSLRKVAGKR